MGGMLLMSKTKPESSRAGRKPENSPASAATSWPRRLTEINRPWPRALSMNTEDRSSKAQSEPRKGTANNVTAATAQSAMLNMPMQK